MVPRPSGPWTRPRSAAQWNSGPDGHVGLARLLNRFGISALRMTMAYHASACGRASRADYTSPATSAAPSKPTRQSASTSCLPRLVGATGLPARWIARNQPRFLRRLHGRRHDLRVKVGILTTFPTTSQTRLDGNLSPHPQGFGYLITQQDLRRYWSSSVRQLPQTTGGPGQNSLLIWQHDSTSSGLFEAGAGQLQRMQLPQGFTSCGHYNHRTLRSI